MRVKKKPTVMVIDDEADLVDIIKSHLEFRGYNVVTASNGAVALEKLKRTDPSLIILDINMPGMGGLELYNKLTGPNGRPKYRVLVLTGRSNLEEVFKYTQIKAFMTKPFEMAELFSRVEQIARGGSDPVVFVLDLPINKHVPDIMTGFKNSLFRPVNVGTFEEARFEAEKTAPEFIVMEYTQSDRPGSSIIREIKKDPSFKNTRIVVYSYAGFPDTEEKSLSAGADVYVGKPAYPAQLAETVSSLCFEKIR